jgi:glycosyltransferase involved in cell wall biosynthesis
MRKLDLMLRFLSELPDALRVDMSLDMVGAGPQKEELQALVGELGLDRIVTIRDALVQQKLLASLQAYDAGLAWVPSERYDNGPSLKLLEYIASGLVPVATATTAHIAEGFQIVSFGENAASFAVAIKNARFDGFPAHGIRRNSALIRSRDWDEIITTHLLPALEELLGAPAAVAINALDARPRVPQRLPTSQEKERDLAMPTADATKPPPRPDAEPEGELIAELRQLNDLMALYRRRTCTLTSALADLEKLCGPVSVVTDIFSLERQPSDATPYQLIQGLLYGYARILTRAGSRLGNDIERLDIRRLARQSGRSERRQCVLFLGPGDFVPKIWGIRAKYIFPDLFGAVCEAADIYMLTGPAPEFAKAGLRALERDFGVKAVQVAVGTPERWLQSTLQMIRDVRPDALSNIFAVPSVLYAVGMAGRLSAVRTILRISGDVIASRLAMGTYETDSVAHRSDILFEQIGLNLADAIIVMSERERQRIGSSLIANRPSPTICIRGVDLDVFKPAGNPPFRAARKFCYVGRQSVEKGYDIIQQTADVVNEIEPEIEFHFAGPFEPRRDKNIIYHGFVEPEALPKFYQECDAFILCSRTEGFPQSLAEAMAMGKPCILSKQIFHDICVDGRDALLVETNAQSVADAVLKIARDTQLASCLATRARAIAETSLDRAKHQSRYRSMILGE